MGRNGLGVEEGRRIRKSNTRWRPVARFRRRRRLQRADDDRSVRGLNVCFALRASVTGLPLEWRSARGSVCVCEQRRR